MSNQFYSYVTNLLMDYFGNSNLKPGDRFYLQVDKDDDVKQFISSFNNEAGATPFSYRHQLGDIYNTFFFNIGGVKLVVVNTSESVNPDFLVTLRNQVGEQKNEWTGTALFSLVSTPLDSISGGSSDLQKEGMPLHPKSFVRRLKIDIEKEIESKVEQIILIERMDQITNELAFHQITFFDFEEIFRALSKRGIDVNDYKHFGLFKDTDLNTFSVKEAKRRLEMNRELFDFVRKYHELGYDEEQLEKKISSKYAKELKLPNWEEVDFTAVKKGYEEAEIISANERVDLVEIKLSDKLKHWDRPQKESTSAGKRKRHIIIFNPDRREEIQLVANFSLGGVIKSLDSDFVTKDKKGKSNVEVSTGRVNMTLHIKASSKDVKFCKVAYKHDGKSSLGCELYIAVLPIEAELFKDFETNFLVDTSRKTIISNLESEVKQVGDGINTEIVEVSEYEQTIDIFKDYMYQIELKSDSFNDENELLVLLDYKESDVKVPVLFRNEQPETVPITAARIWRLKREEKRNFQKAINNSKLVFGNREFYANHELSIFLDWEQQWVDQGFKAAIIDSGTLVSMDIDISITLREAYNRYVNRFRAIGNIPSLSYMDDTLTQLAKDYLSAYLDEVDSFTNGIAAGKTGVDLFKLGVVHAQNEVFFTPFHPLNVAYQMEIIKSLNEEIVENAVLTRLRPDSLVPFIYLSGDTEQLYKSDVQATAIEWITFKPVKKVSISDANKYLARIIYDKLKQFEEHFSYLFNANSRSPIKVNIINIENDLEVVKGLLSWMIDTIKNKDLNSIRPIEVILYREGSYESAFDLLSNAQSSQEFNRLFGLNIDKLEDYDPTDILRVIHQSIVFYKKETTNEFDYAHISYYRMNLQEKYAVQPVNEMTTGIALKGLYSVVPSMKGKENYKSGFGLKNFNQDSDELLVKVASKLNELAANLKNEGNDSYRKGEVIFSRTTAAEEAYLNAIFSASHWVTFLDSNLDLEYFNNLNENLVVIHYNDQYSSSNKYDAITVTNKSNQYFEVIKEFLKSKDVKSTNETAINTIKAFNTFNGEWLLRIVGSKGHYSREKLSIISAIKFALAYFDHPSIKWVPISLEEVLRVAGSVSLNKSDGIFTTKNLGFKGSHSDDLLLMGIEEKDNNLIVHFYPVEVKIGVNSKPVMDKAKVQVTKTKKLFKEALCNKEKPFTSKFYRYFFAQLYLVNAAKLHYSGFWPEKNYDINDSIISKLLSNEMIISFNTDRLLGEGAVLSFQTNAHVRESELFEGVTYVNLPESDGYTGLTKSMNEMYNWIQIKESDFVKESMLSYLYKGNDIVEEDCLSGQGNSQISKPVALIEEESEYKVSEFVYNTNQNKKENNIRFSVDHFKADAPESTLEDNNEEQINRTDELIHEVEEKSIDLELTHDDNHDEDYTSLKVIEYTTDLKNIRIPIGRAENSNKEIFWEYGNNGLANRHLLISGKSGQGKTYFMQCLLLELSIQNISSIVVDYTEGFLPNQLEPEFTNYLGSKLEQRIVYNDKFPINPFRRNVREIGGLTLPESDTDVAERVKSVFSSVYGSLGIQQQNAIYEAVLRGMQQYNEEMDLEILREKLEEDGSSYAKTALSQIRPFIDRKVFSQNNDFSWENILSSLGGVYIIQLTGYPREIQLIITEFILWDLWNYSIRFGNKLKPIPVILDEAQNLDHTEHSPSSKILTEGRKFGWSGWYATQFLKSQLGTDELARLQNASQKIYFAQPEQEISYIASNLSSEVQERKRLESKISNLKKGQCIVHGPLLTEKGELSSQTVVTVDITPLSNRI